MGEFDGKHVLVTGGSGGIGSAIARRFAMAGGRVALFGRNRDKAETVVADIRDHGGDAKAFVCDIMRRSDIEEAVGNATAAFGPVAVLVNNAGWDVFRPFLQTSPEEWTGLIETNLVGALHMQHVVLPAMARQKFGRVITVASDAARVGSTGEAVYAACKAGLIALAKTLAREHARDGITCNVVCPGPTDTSLFNSFIKSVRNPEKFMDAFLRAIPMRRIGSPEDIPGAILFFASEAASYITGQVLSVSGGLTMVD
jgi:2-hydroxycyclohexanecarboxyl-CoA dehydrogenase